MSRTQNQICEPPRAGIVLVAPNGFWCLVRDVKSGKFGLPKGLIEAGETPAQTAVRELFEETGIVATITAATPSWIVESYSSQTYFWVAATQAQMDARRTGPDANGEIVTVEWHNPLEVTQKTTSRPCRMSTNLPLRQMLMQFAGLSPAARATLDASMRDASSTHNIATTSHTQDLHHSCTI